MTNNMHICPNCGGLEFSVTAHVAQDWTVNYVGDLMTCTKECSEVIHEPDDDDLWSCTNCGHSAAGKEFAETAQKASQTPVYAHSSSYALEMNEIAEYELSEQVNNLCGKTIAKVIADSYEDYCLKTVWAIGMLTDIFSVERMNAVLAGIISNLAHDGRISISNKDWAETQPIKAEDDYINSHPGLIDIFVNQYRDHLDVKEILAKYDLL